jgi:hypothetical protein
MTTEGRYQPASLPRILARVKSVTRLDLSPPHRQPKALAVAVATVVSVVLSLLADALLVRAGTTLFPTTKGYVHFRFSDYSKLTIIGVIAACVAWPIVTRLSSAPRWVYARLAVGVSAVLLLPDLYIWTQGQSARAVLVLMAMHLAIAIITFNVVVHTADVGLQVRRGEDCR